MYDKIRCNLIADKKKKTDPLQRASVRLSGDGSPGGDAYAAD